MTAFCSKILVIIWRNEEKVVILRENRHITAWGDYKC